MKYLTFFLSLYFICLISFGQKESKVSLLPKTEDLEELVQAVVNNYEAAVINSAKCRDKPYNISGILQKFTVDAVIEVSTSKTKSILKRTPKEYFESLTTLCNVKHYSNISIKFPPHPINPTQIERFENTCIIKCNIVQVFNAFTSNHLNSPYCDVTIKELSIEFFVQSDKTFKALIKRVSVIDTKNCATQYNENN